MTPAELTQALARAERLRTRNRAQRTQLRGAAAQMADRATAFADAVRPAVEAGDPEAARQHRRTLLGRARARRAARE